MVKKLLVIAGVIGVVALVIRRVKAANDERALWHEATSAADPR